MLSPARIAAAVALCAAACLTLAPGAAADTIRGNQQWVLDMMNVPAAWQQTEGAGVTVAVIDSGVNPDVSDLTGSVTTGPNLSGVRTSPANPNWGVHGTWMASLIAGHGHDGGGSGVIGIAPQSRILSIRVIPDRTDPHYGAYSHEQEVTIQQSLADGIDYAVRHGAKVISMSIGYGTPSSVVEAALLNANAHGVVVIASAGNSGGPSDADYAGMAPDSFPAEYPGVISVGAVDDNGDVASFSSDNLSVQLAAPGVSVPAQGRDGQYWLVSGTSPACALVAGVAALIKSRYPGLAPDLVVSALITTTADRPRKGYDNEEGFGIVNAAAALARAGQLAGGRPGVTSIPLAYRFGGGPANVPPAPVSPRGPGPLILFALLALASLVLIGAASARLTALRRSAP
jgi:subtilisin family serine protease